MFAERESELQLPENLYQSRKFDFLFYTGDERHKIIA